MSISSNPQDGQWPSPFEDLLNQEVRTSSETVDSANIQQSSPTIGTPEEDAVRFPGKQSYQETSAIRAQEFILEQFTAQDINELALVQEAFEQGWVIPEQGTAPQDVGNLLELHGIPVNRYMNANIFHVANELAQGHKVIIGVDKDELWGVNASLDMTREAWGIDPGADHAVVVSGIDTSDPNNIQVIVSDPGTGQSAARYPMSQFIDAWQDSQFFMVATQDPAPQWLPEMANFPYDEGHIPEVANVPYEEFVTLENQPEALDDLFAPSQRTDVYPENDEQAFSPVRPGQPGFDGVDLDLDITIDDATMVEEQPRELYDPGHGLIPYVANPEEDPDIDAQNSALEEMNRMILDSRKVWINTLGSHQSEQVFPLGGDDQADNPVDLEPQAEEPEV